MISTRETGTPITWDCVDCGTDTAPGMQTASQLDSAFLNCLSLKKDIQMPVADDSEIYAVKKSVWRKAGMLPLGGCLCIGCLEVRIKRRLVPNDFPRDNGLNLLPRGSARLMSRRRWPYSMEELAA